MKLCQIETEGRGSHSENRKGDLRRQHPAKEPSEIGAGDVVKEKSKRNQNRAGDNPVEELPECARLVKECAEEPHIGQQANGVHAAEKAEVDQSEIAGLTTEKEKSELPPIEDVSGEGEVRKRYVWDVPDSPDVLELCRKGLATVREMMNSYTRMRFHD